MTNEKMADVFFLPLKVVNGRNIDTVEIESASCHYAVMYAKDQAESICRAVNLHDEFVSELKESLATFKAIYELTQSYGAKTSIKRIENILAKAIGDNNEQ